jgi:hypothetical protein
MKKRDEDEDEDEEGAGALQQPPLRPCTQWKAYLPAITEHCYLCRLICLMHPFSGSTISPAVAHCKSLLAYIISMLF